MTTESIHISEDRVKAIVDLPTPKTILELRGVLQMVNLVHKFIPNLTGIIAPLVALTKKEAGKEVAKRRRPEHDQAYATVKQLLTQAPVLQYFDVSKGFTVQVEASEAGADAPIAQQNGDDLEKIAYFSHRFRRQPAALLCYTQRMLCCGLGHLALETLFKGTTVCVCDRSRGPAIHRTC